MLISPPFLSPDVTSEQDMLNKGLRQPSSRELTTGAPECNYPLSQMLMWHTGLHLKAPNGASPKFLDVRAIADGIIIFKQKARSSIKDPNDGQTFNPFGDAPTWTDNGLLVIEHHTEIGAQDHTPTKIKFYSYYMHLCYINTSLK